MTEGAWLTHDERASNRAGGAGPRTLEMQKRPEDTRLTRPQRLRQLARRVDSEAGPAKEPGA